VPERVLGQLKRARYRLSLLSNSSRNHSILIVDQIYYAERIKLVDVLRGEIGLFR
jgi:hypothetical protein